MKKLYEFKATMRYNRNMKGFKSIGVLLIKLKKNKLKI